MSAKTKTAKQRLDENPIAGLTKAQERDVLMLMREHARMAAQRAKKVFEKGERR